MTKDEILRIISSNDYVLIINSLISAAFYEKDIDFCIQIIEQCFSCINEGVRGTAILCIGHLARIHKMIPEKFAIDLLQKALNDKSKFVRGQAENAIDDIQVFIPLLAEKIENNVRN